MKNLLKFLFDESQRQADMENLEDDVNQVWEDMDKVEDLETKKAPLTKALKALGVEVDELEIDPDGFTLSTEDAEVYRQAKELVLRPDNMLSLAELGWVAAGSGDEAMDGEAPHFKIKFLEIYQKPMGTEDNKDDSKVDLEKLVHMAQELDDQTLNTAQKDYEKKKTERNKIPAEQDVLKAAKDGEKTKSAVKGADKSIKDSVEAAEEVAARLLEQCPCDDGGEPGGNTVATINIVIAGSSQGSHEEEGEFAVEPTDVEGEEEEEAGEFEPETVELTSPLESVQEMAMNLDVVSMFLNDSFPKDKKPVWGTTNLKITKTGNGWALVNYETPLVFRSDEGQMYFNNNKYSSSTTRIQSKIAVTAQQMGIDMNETDEEGIREAIGEPYVGRSDYPSTPRNKPEAVAAEPMVPVPGQEESIERPETQEYKDALQRLNRRQQKRNLYTNITPSHVKKEMKRPAGEESDETSPEWRRGMQRRRAYEESEKQHPADDLLESPDED